MRTPRWVHVDNRWVGSGYPTTRRGSKGPYVCTAQDALTTLGYNTGGLDGVFGSLSENAVRTYQSFKGLTADGILGPITWRSRKRSKWDNGELINKTIEKIKYYL